MSRVDLGDKVREKISGIEGVVVCKANWLYGCERVTIAPHGNKDSKPYDYFTVDEPQIEVIQKGFISRDVADPIIPKHGPREDQLARGNPQR